MEGTLSIADDQLENTVCQVLQHIGANATDGKIKSCHRLNKIPDSTIVKFLRRKDCDQVMRIKSELKKLRPAYLIFLKLQNSALMKGCVPTIGFCGTNTRN